MYKNIDELSKAIEAGEINTFKKAIIAKCIDCSCYEKSEVRNCIVMSCPLWQFRNGKNPYNKRVMTEEQRAATAERLRNVILAKKSQ